MTFDADGDGRLDRVELGKFAEDMIRLRAQMQGGGGRMQGRGFGPPGGGAGGPGGEGFRPRDGGPPGGGPPGGPDGGERPERPRLPQ
jgi:hypothetical protein